MLNFVQNLMYYMTFEVLEPNWSFLERRLRSVATIDDVLTDHNDFLDKCLRDCMLSNREILMIVSRLLAVCSTFTHQMQEVSRQLDVKALGNQLTPPSQQFLTSSLKPGAGGRGQHKVPTSQKLVSQMIAADLERIVSSESFEQTIANFDSNFTHDLVVLLDKLYAVRTDTVGSMVARLDFNGYYRERVKNMS